MSDMKAWETERMYQTRREAEYPTEEDIENEEIERQIEYVEECQRLILINLSIVIVNYHLEVLVI